VWLYHSSCRYERDVRKRPGLPQSNDYQGLPLEDYLKQFRSFPADFLRAHNLDDIPSFRIPELVAVLDLADTGVLPRSREMHTGRISISFDQKLSRTSHRSSAGDLATRSHHDQSSRHAASWEPQRPL